MLNVPFSGLGINTSNVQVDGSTLAVVMVVYRALRLIKYGHEGMPFAKSRALFFCVIVYFYILN